MKKTLLTLSIAVMSLTAMAQTGKQQELPTTINLQTKYIINLYNKIDSAMNMLWTSDIPASKVSKIAVMLSSGKDPISIAIQQRMAFIADSTAKAKKK